jgi:hypothetical protein
MLLNLVLRIRLVRHEYPTHPSAYVVAPEAARRSGSALSQLRPQFSVPGPPALVASANRFVEQVGDFLNAGPEFLVFAGGLQVSLIRVLDHPLELLYQRA